MSTYRHPNYSRDDSMTNSPISQINIGPRLITSYNNNKQSVIKIRKGPAKKVRAIRIKRSDPKESQSIHWKEEPVINMFDRPMSLKSSDTSPKNQDSHIEN